VLGQRTTPEIARAAQMQAPNLINLTTAEEMLRLPDVNTGEAIRRVPGISLETDTGEGRYIQHSRIGRGSQQPRLSVV